MAQPKPITLTAEVVGQDYCAISSNSASLEMKLRLKYRNVGSQKLILYRGHDLFYQTKIRNRPASGAMPYEVWAANARYFDEEFEPIDRASPGKAFVTLPPGAVYEREMILGIGLVNEKTPRSDLSIHPGEHTLNLTVSTWYKSRALAEKLRQQWSRQGFLWFDPLIASVAFLAQPPGSLRPCKLQTADAR